jgi:hypothetical protein
MRISRRSSALDRLRDGSPECRRPSGFLVGLGFVALASCASAIVSLAAMH